MYVMYVKHKKTCKTAEEYRVMYKMSQYKQLINTT